MPSGQVPIVLGTYIHLMHIVPGGAVPKLDSTKLVPIMPLRPVRFERWVKLMPIVPLRQDLFTRCNIVLLNLI